MTPVNNKTVRGYFQKNWEGVSGTLPETPYPISDQNLWFSLPNFRPDQKFDTQFQTWSRARRVTCCYGKYTVIGVNIKWEMVLSPDDGEVANSSKKKYPIQD